MPAFEQLWAAYQQWRNLTQEESAAIEESHWNRVSRAQAQKQELRQEIVQLTEAVQAEIHSPAEQLNFDRRLRSMVNELILLETENNLRLQASLDAASAQKEALDATSHRLRELHRRYVPAREPLWDSHS